MSPGPPRVLRRLARFAPVGSPQLSAPPERRGSTAAPPRPCSPGPARPRCPQESTLPRLGPGRERRRGRRRAARRRRKGQRDVGGGEMGLLDVEGHHGQEESRRQRPSATAPVPNRQRPSGCGPGRPSMPPSPHPEVRSAGGPPSAGRPTRQQEQVEGQVPVRICRVHPQRVQATRPCHPLRHPHHVPLVRVSADAPIPGHTGSAAAPLRPAESR